VELVPGPLTDPSCVADVRFWIRRLGHLPVVLQAEVPGNVSGRLAAAVWRECIHLVLEGVIAVEDLDSAISGGPALAWTAAGPHLRQLMAAGDGGLGVYLSTMLGTYETWWQSLSGRTGLSGEEHHRLVRAIEKAYASRLPALPNERERRLVALLGAMKTE
jgi:3-hydroxybutyryl-CoA dehydrogenase